MRWFAVPLVGVLMPACSGSTIDPTGFEPRESAETPCSSGSAPPQAQVLSPATPEDDGQLNQYDLRPDGESGTIFMGYWGSESTNWGYFRFTLQQGIPADADVRSAELQLWSADRSGWNPSIHRLVVAVEDSADPPVVVDVDDNPALGGRPLSATQVEWPQGGGLEWGLDRYHASPNLRALIADLITTHNGLPQGAHVQLWLRGAIDDSAEVGTPALGTVGYQPAVLTLTWCP